MSHVVSHDMNFQGVQDKPNEEEQETKDACKAMPNTTNQTDGYRAKLKKKKWCHFVTIQI